MNIFKSRVKFLISAVFAVFFVSRELFASPAAAPGPGSYVNDYAGVMDSQTIGKLNSFLSELESKTQAQVAVLTIKTLGGSDIETYAVEIYKKWGIGDKKTNRGVLLLVAVDDHKARIEVGYGLEGILTDGKTGAIQDRFIIPYFKTGDYSTGLTNGVLAIASVIAEDSKVMLSSGVAKRGRQNTLPVSPAQKIFLIILVVVFAVVAIRNPVLLFFFLNTMARGGGGGFGGGGFGGFGGGSSGGGGSSRSW